MRNFLNFSLRAILSAFCLLASIAFAQAELVYISLGSSVARFDLSSGNGSTIAASRTTVASGLTETMGLAFGGDGNLYVAQYTANSLSRININNNTVTAFATGFTNPRGVTYSSATGNYYVANSNSPGSISEISSGGIVSTYLNSGVQAPYGIAFDSAGSLYAANNGSHSLSKVTGGSSSTFATFSAGQGTRGVAVGSNGNVYTSGDFGVNVTTPQGATSNFITTGSGLDFAFGLAFTSSGNLLLAEYINQTIRAYDPLGNLLYAFSTGADRPRYLAFDVDGSGFNQVANAAVPEPSQVAASFLLLVSIGGYFWNKHRKQKLAPTSA